MAKCLDRAAQTHALKALRTVLIQRTDEDALMNPAGALTAATSRHINSLGGAAADVRCAPYLAHQLRVQLDRNRKEDCEGEAKHDAVGAETIKALFAVDHETAKSVNDVG